MFTCFKRWRFTNSSHLSQIGKQARCHRQKRDTSLYSVPEQQQGSNVENICVPSTFDQFLDIAFPCTVWCQLDDADNIGKACNNNNLKITPSELHTVGTRLVQSYFWLFCGILFYRLYDLWWVKKWVHFHKVMYQSSISKAACQQAYFGKGKSRGRDEHTGAILTAACLCY